MFEQLLFYFVFAGQLMLISWYYPRRILGRMQHVLETYPPSKYPRLYPHSIDSERKGIRNFKLMNRSILLVGFTLLVAIGIRDYSSGLQIAKGFPVLYGVIQMAPVLLMEIAGFKRFKQMRQADSRSSRSAALQPRRLFDFVSPKLVATAVFAWAAAIFFDLGVHQFNVSWGHDTIERAIILTLGNGFFAGIVAFNMYGAKLNPYQEYKDRITQIEVAVRSMVLVSIAMSLFFMTVAAGDRFDLESIEPSIASVYFQFLAVICIGSMLRAIRIDDINFDVYREDPTVA